jgi:hypothetical protein
MFFFFSIQDVVTYTLVNGTDSGVNYFYLDRESGEISVRRDLVRDPFITQYLVTFLIYL